MKASPDEGGRSVYHRYMNQANNRLAFTFRRAHGSFIKGREVYARKPNIAYRLSWKRKKTMFERSQCPRYLTNSVRATSRSCCLCSRGDNDEFDDDDDDDVRANVPPPLPLQTMWSRVRWFVAATRRQAALPNLLEPSRRKHRFLLMFSVVVLAAAAACSWCVRVLSIMLLLSTAPKTGSDIVEEGGRRQHDKREAKEGEETRSVGRLFGCVSPAGKRDAGGGSCIILKGCLQTTDDILVVGSA